MGPSQPPEAHLAVGGQGQGLFQVGYAVVVHDQQVGAAGEGAVRLAHGLGLLDGRQGGRLVLHAQSDNINGVSGASYTSYGFYESLQSALQQM